MGELPEARRGAGLFHAKNATQRASTPPKLMFAYARETFCNLAQGLSCLLLAVQDQRANVLSFGTPHPLVRLATRHA